MNLIFSFLVEVRVLGVLIFCFFLKNKKEREEKKNEKKEKRRKKCELRTKHVKAAAILIVNHSNPEINSIKKLKKEVKINGIVSKYGTYLE